MGAVVQIAPPAPGMDRLAAVLTEVVGTVGVDQPHTSPEVWQWMIEAYAGQLVEMVERHGPVRVCRVSTGYRRHLVSIAATALAGIIDWDLHEAGNAADSVNPAEVPDAPWIGPAEAGEAIDYAAWADDTLAACAEAKTPAAGAHNVEEG
jgi:hypothetical protein